MILMAGNKLVPVWKNSLTRIGLCDLGGNILDIKLGK
jgi:hypothetical protein